MKQLLGTIVLSLLLSGCLEPMKSGQSTRSILYKYQYTPVKNMVDGNYWIQGWDKDDAFTGARNHCIDEGEKFSIVKLITHKHGYHYNRRATLIFKC